MRLMAEQADLLWVSGCTLRALQVRSSGAQQAVQQEVEKLQMQSGAAAGLAPPRAEAGNAGTHLGRDLPPAKVSAISSKALPSRSALQSQHFRGGGMCAMHERDALGIHAAQFRVC